MSERYLVTGVQLGMLEAYNEAGKIGEAKELIAQIIDKQFVMNSQNNIETDVENFSL